MNRFQIAALWTGMKPQLDEKQRRLYAGTLVDAYGYGGLEVVHEITGMSENTIRVGKNEVKNGAALEKGRVRKIGGGPKSTIEKQPDIQKLIGKIIDGSTYGTPGKVLSWTTESLRKIEKELIEQHKVEVILFDYLHRRKKSFF